MQYRIGLSQAVEWRPVYDFETHVPVERYSVGILLIYIDLIGPELVYGMQ